MTDELQEALDHAHDMVKGHYPNHREYKVAEALLGLTSARLAYASEFAPDAEGLPDVGSIHANIRALKARIADLEAQLVKANDAWLALSSSADSGKDSAGLSAATIEAGWHKTFSTSNPFCPCDLKSFTKAVRWAEYAVAKEAK